MPPTVELAEYLFTRLKQLGVDSMHGVPGDYNLPLLDYVEPSGLHWVGNCNELNAGYAADAYARIKGLGALITTFGVGELSAANAIAGAYAELAPVVHIVGTPARHLQESRALVHHTLCDGNFRRFAEMARQITIAQANLVDPRTCPEMIDEVILQCLIHSRPVYIELPSDMVAVPVAAERLKTPISIPEPITSKDEAAALQLVLDRLYASSRPMILVDGESRGYNILPELHQLITSTNWPTWTTIFGKSWIDENLPNVHGIWKGPNWASKEDAEYVKSCDLILCFGPHFSNTNTYGGSSIPDRGITIHFMAMKVQTGDKTFRDLPAKHFLSTLLKKLDISKTKRPVNINNKIMNEDSHPANLSPQQPDGPITQDRFYKAFSQYLRPGDIVLGETGTAGHGCREFHLPSHCRLFTANTWLSIGYMLPATQGAALAQRELHSAGKWHQEHPPRTILLIGDGSFQMTAQELSIIIKEQLNVLLILINNDGYTIERCLHGWDKAYNDIAGWNYRLAPALFGASEQNDGYHARTSRAETWGELIKIMEDESEEDGPMLKMVEVIMDREDAPVTLLTLLQQQKDAAKKDPAPA